MPNEVKIKSSWYLGKSGRIEGSREKVKAAINAQKDIPEYCKTYLLAKIDARPKEHNWITLDGHWNETEPSGPNREIRSAEDTHLYSSTENI